MISTYKISEKLTWIDVQNPTKEEVRSLISDYSVEPEIAEDLIDPTVRTRTLLFKDMAYCVTHFPIHNYKKNKSFTKKTEEIDFVITKNILITNHYAPIDELISLGKAIETNSLLNDKKITSDSGVLFMHILHLLYRTVQDRIENIQTILQNYEDDIFDGKERQMVYELSSINRALIYFRDSLLPHKRVFIMLEKISDSFFTKEFVKYFEQIQNEYTKIKRFISFTKEYTDELRKTNDSLLSTKQNEIMKTLTVINFIILPLSVVTGLFGMNTDHTPLSGTPYDFWFIVLLMLVITITSTIIFKRKNWL